MSETTQLIGKAPLTQVRTTTGRIAFVRAGAPAPTDLTDEDRTRLVVEGYLVEVELAVEVEVAVVQTPVDPVVEPPVEPDVEPPVEPVVEPEPTPAPSTSGGRNRRGSSS